MPNARRSFLFSCLISVVILSAVTVSQEKTPSTNAAPKYQNPNLAIEDRVADLLSHMTLEEKVQQIAPSDRGRTEIIDPTNTYTNETARAHAGRLGRPGPALSAEKIGNSTERHTTLLEGENAVGNSSTRNG